MNKSLCLILCFLVTSNLFAQYKAYPKLEKYYLEGNYEKCIDKSESEISENPQEIMPIVWEMKSYIAIDALGEHPLKKNALTKALNLAIRIKKKDKQNIVWNTLFKDLNTLSESMIDYISEYTDQQYSNGISLYEKLKIIDKSQKIDFHKYLYMKENNDDNAFIILLKLVSTNYINFKKQSIEFENMEEAYAALMNEYYDHFHPEHAREVYVKSMEVYGDCINCKENYLHHISEIAEIVGYSTNTITLKSYLLECESADSLLDNPIVQSSLQIIKKYNAIANIKNPTININMITKLIMDYLKFYSPIQLDSSNSFFDLLLADNKQKELQINTNRIFELWIKVNKELQQKKQIQASIININNYLILKKKYEQDFDFLTYCKLSYPSLKNTIQPLQNELEQQIIVQISVPDYIENTDELDKYAKQTDSKIIKEKQYQVYNKKLTDLLVAKNFSGFAVNIIKALNQYPDDARFLTLKKEWVIKDYQINYLTNQFGYEKFFTKLPDEKNCEEGTVNANGHAIVLQKINYCRRLAGSPDSCVLDEALNAKCQKAAFMMSVNSTLSHSPPKNWKCYSPEGAIGAGASNLSLGHAFHDAIMGQMEDDGSGNTACGHRRWILNPKNTVFGHGSSLNATSIYAFGSSNPNLKRKIYFNNQQPICWPSTDYFPERLIPARWSFSLIGAAFENAQVTVTVNGKTIPVFIEPLSYGYGMNTIVWRIEGEVLVNKTYTVKISNVKPYIPWGTNADVKTQNKTYTYHVIPIAIQ